ncbi:HTH-type transcriptional regulatory protein GabR [Pigmentiphaga humi]|uniref:HTH-type transcriptional regulatory protein GabR n=1 Tax=Pigmentiphaga humi TaxID=2478468 RepID=A0A3P4BA88_9BURK|nr:PLP-dependent aminotransferase family protein [Pigmentiphaga humi]VCU72045.1 HTH-type transcriptional regulatory protein GabR [Pigmentiphaga humi]
MNRTFLATQPLLAANREQDAPIYLQLYRRYRQAIAAGELRPGDRVPSVRSLASELNLARGTVEMAYQMLATEGYLVARGAAGTVVSPRLANLAGPRRAKGTALPVREPPCPPIAAGRALPFQLGLPALDAFPRKTWARVAGRKLRALEMTAMGYLDPAGYEPLRRAVAAYLGISRGIACAHEQVFITAGYRGALELAHRALLQPGDLGWYEDPGYMLARQFLERAGLRLTPVPVDEEGLNVDIGQRRAADARFAVVTPTHQSPMGMAMSLPRRLELLEWANHRRAWIIEDDYDSEFRYHGRPLPALKSLDRNERVLYTGTFSKVLLPGLRLAYLVVPASHIERFTDVANHLPGPGSIQPQATVADFMEHGHFARHLRNMRVLYAARRGYLADALAQTLGELLHVQLQAGGMHVLARLKTRQNDKALASSANAIGLAVQALGDWRMRKSSTPGGLLMGYANFATAEEAAASVRRLRDVLK